MSGQDGQPPRNVLVFGGTFDPPHLAHARLAARAAAVLGCNEVVLVPAAINPLKAAAPSANEHRLAMLLLAATEVPGARINTMELDRAGPSYTVDTLRSLTAEYRCQASKHAVDPPSARLFLLLGADQALEFHRWRQWQEILQLATPAVMVRPPWTCETFVEALKREYSPEEAEFWNSCTLPLPLMDVSASEIRRRLAAGESIDGLLHPAVAAYIKANGLYGVHAAKPTD